LTDHFLVNRILNTAKYSTGRVRRLRLGEELRRQLCIPINKFRGFNQDVVFLALSVSKSRFLGFSSKMVSTQTELITY
jgi:hypothetical protein